jgi:hypothetical protein
MVHDESFAFVVVAVSLHLPELPVSGDAIRFPVKRELITVCAEFHKISLSISSQSCPAGNRWHFPYLC